MRKLHVLGIVGFRVFPDLMGGQKYVAQYYRELSKECSLVICASRDNAYTEINDTPFYRFLFNHWKSIGNILYIFRLAAIIKQRNIDIILIDHSYFGWLGVFLQALTGKPFVIKSANLEYQRFKETGRPFWRIYMYYEKWVHRKAIHNFFITGEDRQAAIQIFQLASTASSVLPCFIPKKAEGISKKELRQSIIDKYKLSPSTLLFYFNGTLDYTPNIRGIDILLHQIIPKLKEQHIACKIIITGNRIQPKMASALATESYIIFEGYVPNTSLYHVGTDAFICMLDTTTGIKTKIIDAFTFQQKVICTESAINGCKDIDWGNQLVLVKDGDWDSFANKMAMTSISDIYHTPNSFYQKHDTDRIIADSLLSLRHAARLS
jgi:hypothetical protein